MNCLIVTAHPLGNSLCRVLSDETAAHLKTKGYDVVIKDLYKERFDPVLTAAERASYYDKKFDSTRVSCDIEQLLHAQCLVLAFPTWWFGFPAILKGWFDRVWAPGSAYAHTSNLGKITPCLDNLKQVKVITTLGSPFWVDYFVLRRPVRRILKTALLGACTKKCAFKMLTFYKCENLNDQQVEKMIHKIKAAF